MHKIVRFATPSMGLFAALSLSSLFAVQSSAQEPLPPKGNTARIRRVGSAKISKGLHPTKKSPRLSVNPAIVLKVLDETPHRSLKDIIGPQYVTGLTVRRFAYNTANRIELNVSVYDGPSRLSSNVGGDHSKTLIVLVPGADDGGTINDQDALCGKLAAELVSHGFLVAVPDYRKFSRGVAAGDYSGLFSSASSDILTAIAVLKNIAYVPKSKDANRPDYSGTYRFDSNHILVAGLSYGGLLMATIAHSEDVVGLAMGSGFISPGDLTGFLAIKTIPVAILYNSNDQSVVPGVSDWGAGGAAIAAELKRRGKTVYDSSVSTPCSDGNHVPVVGRDSEATVSEYVTAFAANIIKLVP